MSAVRAHPVPVGSTLHGIAGKRGFYTDCFAIEIEGAITLARFVEAFYTTPLFKAERIILRLFARLPSTDLQARQLARGEIDRFAAWHVRERSDFELLMKAIGRTSSWFRIEETGDGTAPRTRLLFGSVVEPAAGSGGEEPGLGFLYRALLRAHRLYSKLLLAAAARRLH